MSLNFVTGVVREGSMFEDLRKILDCVDSDFTGDNGEDYFDENGQPFMESAISIAEDMECEQERIEYVIEKCKKYSGNYYGEFKYTVTEAKEGWFVAIATV